MGGERMTAPPEAPAYGGEGDGAQAEWSSH